MRHLKTPTLVVAALLGCGALLSACSSQSDDEGSALGSSPEQLATAEYDVDGMTCGGCSLATEMALKRLDGVRSAQAEYDDDTGSGWATVEYDRSRVTPDQMIAAIEDVGFSPTLKRATAAQR